MRNHNKDSPSSSDARSHVWSSRSFDSCSFGRCESKLQKIPNPSLTHRQRFLIQILQICFSHLQQLEQNLFVTETHFQVCAWFLSSGFFYLWLVKPKKKIFSKTSDHVLSWWFREESFTSPDRLYLCLCLTNQTKQINNINIIIWLMMFDLWPHSCSASRFVGQDSGRPCDRGAPWLPPYALHAWIWCERAWTPHRLWYNCLC